MSKKIFVKAEEGAPPGISVVYYDTDGNKTIRYYDKNGKIGLHAWRNNNPGNYISLGRCDSYICEILNHLSQVVSQVCHKLRHDFVTRVLGYEFRHAHHFKTFIQLELSQPTFGFGGYGHRYGYKPGVALIGGFGF